MVEHRIKAIVPIPMDAAGVANRASQLPAGLLAPGFRPEFAAVPWGAALGDSYHDMLLIGLGLTHSKQAFPSPEVAKDADIRRSWA